MTAEKITITNGKLQVPAEPIIPCIAGDGIGPEIMAATVRVLDAAVAKAYSGQKKIHWRPVLAGEQAFAKTAEWLPVDTLNDLRKYIVSIKGPLTTPVGGGIRSLNVAIRQELDLYACIRPIYYFPGTPSPLKNPEKTNLVIFRENTEDVYAGLEWASGSKEAQELTAFLGGALGVCLPPQSGIGLKPISPLASKNLMRKAISYALHHKLPSVTLMHKGNIMKFTEGAFKEWGYQVALAEFRELVITEDELYDNYNGQMPPAKLLIKDRIADNMFQQVLLHPEEYSVIATPNLNGDYLSDACAAQVGGLGMAPGGNVGDYLAVFEATHGTAPKYTGQNKANPSSLILSGALMMDYLGWTDPAALIRQSLGQAIINKTVTYDLARGINDAQELGTREFATTLINNF